MINLPQTIKAVIMDVDGTLLDSLSVWADADREFLAKRNIAYDPQASQALKSLHFVSASQYLIDYYSLTDSLETVCGEIADIVRQRYFHEIPLKEGVLEFIEQCRRNDICLCAATSNSRELAEGALSANGIINSLRFVITSDEVGSDKSSPDIFLKCAERLGAGISQTAVFEDSRHAAYTAKEAGFYVVGVNNGDSGDFSKLSEYADFCIDSFSELCKENSVV